MLLFMGLNYSPDAAWYNAFSICVYLCRLFSPSLWPTTAVVWSMWFAASLGYYGIVLLTTELHSSAAGTCLNNTFTSAANDYSSIFLDTLGEVPVFAITLLVDVVGRKW